MTSRADRKGGRGGRVGGQVAVDVAAPAAAKAVKRGARPQAAPEYWNANRRVIMTQAREQQTIATADPCDRAHVVRDVEGKLVSARVLGGQATPRRYPRAYMHEVVEGRVEGGAAPGGTVRLVERAVAVVSDETVFDETFERERRLRALGLPVGGVCGARSQLDEAVWSKGDLYVRDLLRSGRARRSGG